jgi:hypothetical protein
MTELEILENNKAIANFMGVKIGEDGYSWRPGCTEPLQERHLNYHASWGWLMPVIEKISRIEVERKVNEDTGETIVWTHYPVTFGMLDSETGRPMFRFYASGLFEADTLIEAAYEAVVDFVKWKNE